MPRHVRKGDMVIVTSGFNKGKVGQIMRVIPEVLTVTRRRDRP